MSDILRVGVAGLGTVGVGVLKVLSESAEVIEQRAGCGVQVVAVSARDKNKDRGVSLDGVRWHDDPVLLGADEEVDVVVEVIGGDEGVAYDLCETALKNGKHFVTANKALIAKHGKYFAQLAEENNVCLAFEAAVAGGIPVVKSLREGLAANKISRVSGILNGTCNYMLTVMGETGREFVDILQEAQDMGYAEADPTFDVDGIDAAHKLAILSAMAFGVQIDFDAVYIEGIRRVCPVDIEYAEELGYKIKLIGLCFVHDNGDVEQRVCPCLVPKSSKIAGVDGVNNAVVIDGDAVGQVMLVGPGAGEGATSSAVVADLVDVACGRSTCAFNVPVAALRQADFVDISGREGEYYMRIVAKDETGVLADVSEVLRDEGISVDSILQKSAVDGDKANIIVVTHKNFERIINQAVEKIGDIANVVERPYVIRIENM